MVCMQFIENASRPMFFLWIYVKLLICDNWDLVVDKWKFFKIVEFVYSKNIVLSLTIIHGEGFWIHNASPL